MQVFKLEVIVIDFDDLGAEGITRAIESANYPNHCISPKVRASVGRDIGEWSNDNPLNNTKTAELKLCRLFGA